MKTIEAQIFEATSETKRRDAWKIKELIDEKHGGDISRDWITESMRALARKDFITNKKGAMKRYYYKRTPLFADAFHREVLGAELVSPIREAKKRRWSVSSNDIYKRLGG